MKKTLTAVVLVIAMLISSAAAGFAGTRLSRPVIEEIDAGKNSIKIDWNYIAHSDGYKVYRSTSSDGTYKYIGYADESWYRDYSIKKGTRYYYKVRAVSYEDYDNSYLSKWRSGKVKKPVSTSSSKTNSQTVYITSTGSKYHRAGCGYLWNSSYPISLSKAKSSGYSPCSRCW